MVSLLGYGPTVESTLVYLVAVEQLIRVVVRCSQNLLASVAAVVVVVVVVAIVASSVKCLGARMQEAAHTQAWESGLAE